METIGEQIIYVKRFIKTEADLPLQNWIKQYHVHLRSRDVTDYCIHDDRSIHHGYHSSVWVDMYDWYLQETTLAELIRDKLLNKEVIRFEHYKNNPVCDESGLEITDFHPEFIEGVEYIINKLTEQ